MSVSVYYELSSNCWTNCATTWLLFCWIWESRRFSNLRCFKGPEPQMFGPYGYGSIPINTIFRGMNIHKSQLFWCELQGYKVLTHCHIWIVLNGAFNLAFCIPCVSVCMLKWRPLSKMDDISSCKKLQENQRTCLDPWYPWAPLRAAFLASLTVAKLHLAGWGLKKQAMTWFLTDFLDCWFGFRDI